MKKEKSGRESEVGERRSARAKDAVGRKGGLGARRVKSRGKGPA